MLKRADAQSAHPKLVGARLVVLAGQILEAPCRAVQFVFASTLLELRATVVSDGPRFLSHVDGVTRLVGSRDRCVSCSCELTCLD